MRRLLLAALLAVSVAGVVDAQGRGQSGNQPSTDQITLTNGTCTVEGVTSTGCAALYIAGYSGVAIQITGNASANTLTFRGSGDGTNFVAMNCFAANSTTAVTSTSGTGLYHCGAAGFKMVEAIVTSYVGGTAVVTINAALSADGSGTSAAGSGSNPAAGATGSAVPASASYTGVSNGGTLVGLPGDGTNGAWVNCKAGCAAAGDSTASSQSIALGSGNTSTFPNGPTPYGLALAGDAGASFTVAGGGNLSAILTPQCSTDGGTTYPVNGYFVDPVTGQLTQTQTVSSPSQTVYQVLCPQGSSHAALKATTYTSGSSSFTGRATVIKVVGGIALGAVTTNTPTTAGTGTLFPISLDTNGLTRVSLKDTPSNTNNFNVNLAASAATVAVSGTFWQATQPVSGTFWQATQPVSVADGSLVTLGAKADAKSTATDTTAVSIMSVLKEISAMAQAPASTPVTGTFWQATQPVSGTVTANQGGAPWSVNQTQQNGSALASPDANSYQLTSDAATATTTAGTSTCYLSSGASTNSTSCKGSAGNVYAIHLTNTTTTTYYLRMYNTSSAPTCSSSTGYIETVPALGAPSASANGAVNGRSMTAPQAYSTGIGFCFTGGGSSTDNTNAATGVYITILYK